MTLEHPDTPQAIELCRTLGAGFIQKEFGHLITATRNAFQIIRKRAEKGNIRWMN